MQDIYILPHLQSFAATDIISSNEKKNKIIYKKYFQGRCYAIKKLSNQKDSGKQRKLKQYNAVSQHLLKIIFKWSIETTIYIAMEYYQYNLSTYLAECWEKIRNNPTIIISIFLQISFGLVQFQKTYQDLKLTKILLRERQQKIQLCLIVSDENQKHHNQNMEHIYIAPQLKNANSQKYSMFSRKCNVWSLGIILFQICSIFYNQGYDKKRVLPQFPQEIQEIIRYQLMPKNFQETSQHFKKNMPVLSKKIPKILRLLMHNIIQINQVQRLSLLQILQSFQESQNLLDESQLVANKDILIHLKNYIVIQKIKSTNLIYNEFYLPLRTKIDISKGYHYSCALFVYYAMIKIYQNYQELCYIGKSKATACIFGNQLSKQSFLIQIMKLKSSINLKYNDNQLKDKKTQFLTNQKLKQVFIDSIHLDYKKESITQFVHIINTQLL